MTGLAPVDQDERHHDERDPDDRPVALVVGGSRGLGLLIARLLVDRGHPVAVAARDRTELEGAVAELSESSDRAGRGRTVRGYPLDVADAEAVEAAVAAAEADLGPVGIAFCVAGIIQVGPLDALDRSHFREAVDVMLWGPVNTAFAVMPGMRRRGHGRIGVITSIGGLIAAPHLLPYSTAKFGAVGFARGLRAELTGTGVTVTTVLPGLMRTGSQLHARFVGDHGREYAWFATAASLPLLSTDAERAAVVIVDQVLAGRSDVLLTPLAQVAARVAGLSPRLTAAVLGLTSRLLPRADGPTETLDGADARRRLPAGRRRLADTFTTLGDRAADRLRQR